MAAEQSNVGRTVSQLISWLAVPRVITLPILVCLGVALAQLVWCYVDSVKIHAWLSGLAAPFCIMCATTVWGMREKLDELIDTDLLDGNAFERYVELTNSHRNKSTFWASLSALMGLIASGPALSNQFIGPVWQWMVLPAGGAVFVAIYAYLLANYWELQMRAFKNDQKRAIRKQTLAQEASAIMNVHEPLPMGRGWSDGPSLGEASNDNH